MQHFTVLTYGLICDGPVHQSGKKKQLFWCPWRRNLDLTFMLQRTLTQWTLWNWAPNPAMMLSAILNEDDDGQ
jgi:hypothetical protein